MNLDWLYGQDNRKSNIVKAIVIPETDFFESHKDIPKLQENSVEEIGFSENRLNVIKKSLSEVIDKGYELLGRAETKRVLRKLLEQMDKEEEKNA